MTEDNKRDFIRSLHPVLVNHDNGADLLAHCPHRDLTDEISVIAATDSPVDHEMAATFQLTQNELLDSAIQNQAAEPYRLAPMEDMIGLSSEDSGPVQMLVLTNREANLGSGEILNPAAMQEASERLDSEQLYVIPSSTHEVILLPRNCGVAPDELDLIVHEVNEQVVLPHDRLADHSLVYDHRTRSLSEARSQNQSQCASIVRNDRNESSISVDKDWQVSSSQTECSRERRRHS